MGDLNAYDFWLTASYGSGTNNSEHGYKTGNGNKLVDWLEHMNILYTINRVGPPTTQDNTKINQRI
jgi:hypothetical protein